MNYFTRKLRAVSIALLTSLGISASAQTLTLDLDVHDITEYDAKVTVTPSITDATFFLDFKTKADFEASGGAAKAIENQIATWEEEKWGGQTWIQCAYWSIRQGVYTCNSLGNLIYDDLTPGTDYVVYAFGIDNQTGEITSKVFTQEFRTLGGDPVEPVDPVEPTGMTLSLSVDDISASDAWIECTPSSNDIPYVMFVKSKSEFEANGGAEKAIENQIAYFEDFGKTYDSTWQQAMAIFYHYGQYGQMASESFDLLPDTEYVYYAFSVDNDKNVIAPLVTKEFTTLGAEPSDNTFTLSVVGIEPINSRKATVKAQCVPTNEDTYTVKCVYKETVDDYDLTTPEGEKLFIQENLLYPLPSSMIYSGTKDLSFDNILLGKECYLAAVGVTPEGVATTGVTLLPFTCEEAKPDEPVQATLSLVVDDITPTNAWLECTPSSDEIGFVMFVEKKSDFEAKGGVDKVIENQIAYFEKTGANYQMTWQQAMALFQHYGQYSQMADESFDIFPNTEYVFYAFAIDNDKNVLAPVTTTEFKTPRGEQIDLTFDLSVTDITLTSAERATVKARCVPSNNTETYNVKCIDKATVDKYDLTTEAGEQAFIEEEMMYPLYANMIYSGTKDLTFEKLTVGEEYCLAAFGVTTAEVPTTGVTLYTFTCGETKPELMGTIDLSVTDITPMNAHIKVTPSSEDFIYFYDVTLAELVEEKGGEEAIPEKFIIDWWKFIADFYDDLTWQDVMLMQCISGPVDAMAADLVQEGDLSKFYWNQDLVLYAVGFDQNGNVVTPPATCYFKTPEPAKSDMMFDFEFVNAEVNESGLKFNATINVLPSNDNETYMVCCLPTRIYDQYDKFDEDEMFEFLSYQFTSIAQECEGPTEHMSVRVSFLDENSELQDYYLLAAGWNEGPTTALYEYVFNAETSKIEQVALDDVVVMGGQGEIYIFGDIDNARVYNTAGQCVAQMDKCGKASVATGLYIVNYTVNGTSKSAKVLVK